MFLTYVNFIHNNRTYNPCLLDKNIEPLVPITYTFILNNYVLACNYRCKLGKTYNLIDMLRNLGLELFFVWEKKIGIIVFVDCDSTIPYVKKWDGDSITDPSTATGIRPSEKVQSSNLLQVSDLQWSQTNVYSMQQAISKSGKPKILFTLDNILAIINNI